MDDAHRQTARLARLDFNPVKQQTAASKIQLAPDSVRSVSLHSTSQRQLLKFSHASMGRLGRSRRHDFEIQYAPLTYKFEEFMITHRPECPIKKILES